MAKPKPTSGGSDDGAIPLGKEEQKKLSDALKESERRHPPGNPN